MLCSDLQLLLCLQRGEITLDQAAAAGMPTPGGPAAAAGAGATPTTGQTPPAAASPLPGAPAVAAGPPTQYLAVSGMVTADVLADDEEYAEVGANRLLHTLLYICGLASRNHLDVDAAQSRQTCLGSRKHCWGRSWSCFSWPSPSSRAGLPHCSCTHGVRCWPGPAFQSHRGLLQVIEDLRDECAKHGTVTAVTVPRPADKAQAAALFGTANIGKVRAAACDVISVVVVLVLLTCDACWPGQLQCATACADCCQ